MWIFEYAVQDINGVRKLQVFDLSFTVGTGMNGGGFTVTTTTDPLDYYYPQKDSLHGWIKDENETVVAFGVLTRTELDLPNSRKTMTFSGVQQLMRGAILTKHTIGTGTGIVTDGANKLDIKASSKLGVLGNIIKHVHDAIMLPFYFSRTQTSGTTYSYPLYDGDFKVLADVVSDYIERENVPAIRWTYTRANHQNDLHSFFETCDVNFTQIAAQTESLKLPTKAIKNITPISFDSSDTLKYACMKVSISDGDTQKTKYTWGSHFTGVGDAPLNTSGLVEGHDNVTDDATLIAYARERANQYASAEMTVTLDQYTTAPYKQSFTPANIGKVVSFPLILTDHDAFPKDNVVFVYGVVTEATFKNMDTVDLKLSNVQLQLDDVLDVATMAQQTATPKTTLNLLNTLSNNLGSQTVKPKS